jgi:RNA polymerase sigma factor (sigma-70 family)
MGKGQHDAGSRYVRTLFNVGTVGGLKDGQLLERFRTQGGETAELAFATLVERHGPMVLRVCRSVLRDTHEAHDAFQATFLVLVRRAGSLWVRDSLAPWLHQVAYRVASCARATAIRRRRHEQRAAELSSRAERQEDRDDLGDVLHDEVNRLPLGCRAAVVLCYFDGLSPEQAARQLGCPVGTVQSRLARGRERLRSRLTRRGLSPALAALEAHAEAAPVVPPPALVEATIRSATPLEAATAGASGSVIQLTQGVLRSMFLIKLRTALATLIAVAALAAGAHALLQKRPDARSQPNLERIQTELGAQQPAAIPQPAALQGSVPPPPDLTWTDIAGDERLRVIEQLAAISRGNYEKIKTWQGAYSYVSRQYLDDKFVSQMLGDAFALAGKRGQQGKSEALMQENDSLLTFAVDVDQDAIYRDIVTSRMRFLKVGSDEEVKIPNVGAADHRSIVTPTRYLYFLPNERATSSFLPDHPDAQNKRRVDRFPAREARMREGGSPDPREFYKTDPGNMIWTGLELYAKALRGESGAEQKNVAEQRLKIGKADGPGGKWYREQVRFTNPGGPILWVSTLWSPQAGYNPVSRTMTADKLDGKPQSKLEWQWTMIDGIYVPSMIKDTNYQAPGGGLSRERQSKLQACTVNRPLGTHQFDEGGLGLEDGDLILNHDERVAYIIKGREPVKLANFGERSVLRVPQPKPTVAQAKQASTKPVGRIYTTASLETDEAGRPISSVVAVNPESGEVTKVFDESPGRLRVAPDGRSLAYVWGETSRTLPPAERMRQSLWVRPVAGGGEPTRVIRLDNSKGGDLPIWSADGKQFILSIGSYDEARKQWVFETSRMNADGSGREALKIPEQDGVQDWSPDGEWVVTTSSRNAKIGWQLYVMHLDGTNQRQVTEGGNPFYVRFSPDGRRLLYCDGPAPARQGIWVVNIDGKDRHLIFPTGKAEASACWSPDGQQIAVAISGSSPQEHGRLEIVNLDGTHRTLLTMPGQEIANMPDWR